ncbi:APC family permease [Nonomuraea turkmeniaca]|uniref:APC family permease n=1 Tax=Nonomuraea turkmeniaca TaxID=103838 RepID=A0A5S4FEQ3_9ACTN|nr:APC family permease [Nonomuraea turkmeniaca]TMR17087.1 APC family permease [Nonomuraea turkmeniaca]
MRQSGARSAEEAGALPEELARRLGTTDAVVVGLSAMIGAGVFAALAPAAEAAGYWLLASLAVAAVVAYCNATSSARLAARYPESGGTYVYGRRRLGPLWGYLAGWGFTVGKTASCAAMALTFGAYVAPGLARPLAIAAVVALTVLNLYGVRRSAWVAKMIVAFVLAVLAAVIVVGFTGDSTVTFGWFAHTPPAEPFLTTSLAIGTAPAGVDAWGVLQAAGLLFFAFAGYARIATLGEEVRDPARTIPRAVSIALGITLVVYALVAMGALRVLQPELLARSAAPLIDLVNEGGAGWLAPVVGAGAAVAALGALLALLLGVSRTVLAMARERDLPGVLAAVDPVRQTPRRAEAAVGVAVIVLLLVADLRGAIGFSSFGVLVYYAIANACAFTLTREEGAPPKVVPVLGLGLCLVLAATLPAASVLAGLAVFAVGLVIWLARHRSR